MTHTGNRILRPALLRVRPRPSWAAVAGEALRRIPGVAEVRVDESGHALKVEYDPALASPEQFLNSVRQAGYEASLEQR